jgi:hypothetical protein
MLTFHGRKIAEQPSAFHIEIVQQQMSLNDIFTFIEDKLKVRDMQALVSGMRQESIPIPKPSHVKNTQAREQEQPQKQLSNVSSNGANNQRNQDWQQNRVGNDSRKGVLNQQWQGQGKGNGKGKVAIGHLKVAVTGLPNSTRSGLQSKSAILWGAGTPFPLLP